MFYRILKHPRYPRAHIYIDMCNNIGTIVQFSVLERESYRSDNSHFFNPGSVLIPVLDAELPLVGTDYLVQIGMAVFSKLLGRFLRIAYSLFHHFRLHRREGDVLVYRRILIITPDDGYPCFRSTLCLAIMPLTSLTLREVTVIMAVMT